MGTGMNLDFGICGTFNTGTHQMAITPSVCGTQPYIPTDLPTTTETLPPVVIPEFAAEGKPNVTGSTGTKVSFLYPPRKAYAVFESENLTSQILRRGMRSLGPPLTESLGTFGVAGVQDYEEGIRGAGEVVRNQGLEDLFISARADARDRAVAIMLGAFLLQVFETEEFSSPQDTTTLPGFVSAQNLPNIDLLSDEPVKTEIATPTPSAE